MHHYVVSSEDILNNRKSIRDYSYFRVKIKSNKIAPRKSSFKEIPEKSMNKQIALELYINRKKKQINWLKNMAFGLE